jgi:hypothetical protein
MENMSQEDIQNMMKEMDNMDPAQMAAASKEALKDVKQALAEGSMTKADVAEFEKAMGMDIKEMVKMMDNGQLDKAKLKQLEPEMEEFLDIFRQLAKIK